MFIEIKKSDYIIDVKKEIEKHLKINYSYQILYYKGNKLIDDKTISDYDIENESIISLSFDGGKNIIIFVKGILGNTFTLNVQTLYNISMIKKIIYLREGIDENDQRLTFLFNN